MKIKSNINKIPKKLVFRSYDDSWEGCKKLVSASINYITKLNIFCKKINQKDYSKIFNFNFNSKTNLNPSFFAVIINFFPIQIIQKFFSDDWKKISFTDKHFKEKGFKDSKNNNWININSIYPKYENKGTIIISSIFMEKSNSSSDQHSDSLKEVQRILEVFQNFNINSVKLEDYQYRAIKYIVGELIANIFSHAFPSQNKKNKCNIGIFIEERTNFLFVTISDSGKTIPQNVFDRNCNRIKCPGAAIEWSFKKGNTTKNISQQGGMGLYRVQEIVIESDGELGVWSLNGCYYKNGTSSKKHKNFLKNYGTVFYMKINLSKIKKDSVKLNEHMLEELKEVFL